MVLICEFSGYSLMVESSEYARKNNNPRNMLVQANTIEILNKTDIAQRTQKDIEWHNRRELAYRKKHEAWVHDRRAHSTMQK